MVKRPIIFAMKLGVGEISWSTDTTLLGSVITLGSYVRACLSLHGFLVAFEYKDTEHIRILHLLSLFGMTPILAMF